MSLLLDKLNALASQLKNITIFTVAPIPKGDATLGVTQSIYDLAVTAIHGNTEAFNLTSKEFQVIPLDMLISTFEFLCSVMEKFEILTDKANIVLKSHLRLEKGLKNLLEITNFANLAITASLITGLVGSYFTSKEEYIEYKKTKFCFNALLVISFALHITSALHTRSTLSHLLRP